jgi:cytochrome b6
MGNWVIYFSTFCVTGYSLPWDQVYWVCKIVTGVQMQSPVIGGNIVELLRGTSVGQGTLHVSI